MKWRMVSSFARSISCWKSKSEKYLLHSWHAASISIACAEKKASDDGAVRIKHDFGLASGAVYSTANNGKTAAALHREGGRAPDAQAR